MSSHKLIIKDAVWQILGRVISALCGFLIIKFTAPYLGDLRYGDYGTILKYFAIFSALADFGLYVVAIKQLGVVKDQAKDKNNSKLKDLFGKFVGARIISIIIVYTIALLLAYFLPAYTSNPYIVWGLPLGMLFSASFMFAGIMQLPLQIFWRMKQVSISLILARISQIVILFFVIFVFFPHVNFDGGSSGIVAFALILFSVLVSGLTQLLYVYYKSNKILPLKIKFDWKFTKDIFKSNTKYGLAYFLSSFHTLLTLIFLSLFFPTSEGYNYTGIWALGLSLIEIFLIIPSALGNSMLHNIANATKTQKAKSFGSLLTLMIWIGGIIFVNFLLFNTQIIKIISSDEFIGTGLMNIAGSNNILPFLAIVLCFSFVKQVFNYVFIAHDKQNKILGINLIGVIIGVGIGLYMIPKYNILGGVITQIILEVLFMLGAWFVVGRLKLLPKINLKYLFGIFVLIFIFSVGGYYGLSRFNMSNWLMFFLIAGIFNLLFIALSWKSLKKVVKGLGIDEE